MADGLLALSRRFKLMPANQFEDSRVTEGTLRTGARHTDTVMNESATVSRDDVRDGFDGAQPPADGDFSAPANAPIPRVPAARHARGRSRQE